MTGAFLKRRVVRHDVVVSEKNENAHNVVSICALFMHCGRCGKEWKNIEEGRTGLSLPSI
jgi:hypothetical protein